MPPLPDLPPEQFHGYDGQEEVDVLDKMEEIIREAGVQLTLATTATTNSDDDGHIIIDPSVAISFIMLVPKTAVAGKEKTNYYHLPSFENFHEFFIDLEDRLLDECDDYWASIDNDDETGEHFDDDNNVNSSILGCDITVAAFHPEWQFNGGSEDGESDDNDNSNIIVHPIDYEKRTPYPTISIVMSSVIDSLMKEREEVDNNNDDDSDSSSAPVTERIADLNEKTLCAIGVERLKEIFDKDVLECPGRDSHLS